MERVYNDLYGLLAGLGALAAVVSSAILVLLAFGWAWALVS